MFPPKQAPQQPQAMPMQKMPMEMPMGQPAAAEPAAGAEPMQSGLRPVEDIGFNQDVQNIVLSRIQTLNPEEGKLLDAVISPQTIGVFLKILPELQPLFEMMSSGGAQPGPVGAQPPAAAPPASAPGQGAQFAGAPPSDDEEDEDEEDEDEEDEDEEDETDNPLAGRQVSRGLVG